MAALTRQCSACKKPVGAEARAVRGSLLCGACENALKERTKHGSGVMQLVELLLRGSVPLIKPPPRPSDLKAKRKEFIQAVMRQTKALGLQAFRANKKITSVKDYYRLSTAHTLKHPKHVLVIWIDMAIPWCVEWANLQFSQLGEGDAYGIHWVCLHQDNYSRGSFHRDLEYNMCVFDSMIENAGKPPPTCSICNEPQVDSNTCVQCKKQICGLCRKKWLDKCTETGQTPSCPYCRNEYELQTLEVNYSEISSDLKK